MIDPAVLDHAGPRRTRRQLLGLAWGISIGQAVLLGAATAALVRYWLMFSFPLRIAAAAVFSLLALTGIWRLVRFYRRLEQRPPAPVSPVVNGVIPKDRVPGRKRDTELAAAREVKASG